MGKYKEYYLTELFGFGKKKPIAPVAVAEPKQEKKQWPDEKLSIHGTVKRDLDRDGAPAHRMVSARLHREYNNLHQNDKRTPAEDARHKELEAERSHRGFRPKPAPDYHKEFEKRKSPAPTLNHKDQHGKWHKSY